MVGRIFPEERDTVRAD